MPRRQGTFKNPENRDQWVISRDLPQGARGLASALHCLARVPRKKADRVVGQGLVKVNGLVVRDARHRVETGDRLDVAPGVVWHPRSRPDTTANTAAVRTAARKPEPRKTSKSGRNRPALLYRDEDIAVVFKPAGLLTVPTPKGDRKTLIHWLSRELGQTQDRKKSPSLPVRAVQRLDREVSGVLVFALSEQGFAGLRRQFELHLPERRYLALVAGEVQPPQGTFSSIMATARSLRRYSAESGKGGERAITHYRVKTQTADAALVEVWLETGRRHQIRVHFAEAGHPVLGDARYKRASALHPDWPVDRLALHAASLGFEHPVSGKAMLFHSDLPYEFSGFPGLKQVAEAPVLNKSKKSVPSRKR